MDEKRKQLEAIGDGLLLAVARLYLKERHAGVSYRLSARLVSLMVRNSTLARIAEAEGIKGLPGEKPADSLEVAIALRYYQRGFDGLRLWLFALFNKHLDVRAEAERILNPPPADPLFNSVRGALKMVVSQHGGKLTGGNLDAVTKQIVGQLRDSQGMNGNGAHT